MRLGWNFFVPKLFFLIKKSEKINLNLRQFFWKQYIYQFLLLLLRLKVSVSVPYCATQVCMAPPMRDPCWSCESQSCLWMVCYPRELWSQLDWVTHLILGLSVQNFQHYNLNLMRFIAKTQHNDIYSWRKYLKAIYINFQSFRKVVATLKQNIFLPVHQSEWSLQHECLVLWIINVICIKNNCNSSKKFGFWLISLCVDKKNSLSF